MNKNLILFILFTLCFSCTSITNKEESYQKINLADIISAKSTIDFDEIVKNDKLIQLEKSENSIVGNIWKLMVCDDKIYVQDDNKTLFVFDFEGKFITKINAIGKGPNEYVELSDFDIDSSTGNIKILDETTGTILIFNEEGKIVKTVKAPRRCNTIVSIDNINYVYTPFRWSGDRDAGNEIITKINDSGDETLDYFFATKIKKSPYLMYANTIVDDEKKLYKIPFNDTIYRVSENSIVPEYILDAEDKTIPLELYESTQAYQEKISDYIEFVSLQILNNYFFISLSYKGHRYKSILSRKTNSTLLNNDDAGIFNKKLDIEIWPSFASDNAAYFLIEPYKLNADNIQKEFGITITENDNPLVYITYL